MRSVRSTGEWIAGICLLAFIVYVGAVHNLFVAFDDNSLIYQNAAVLRFSPSSLRFIFTHYDPELYIPFTFLVYQFLHLGFGELPGAYHAASILLHLLNIVLVAWIILQLTNKKMIAVLVAFFFALHPLHSETVLWASAMKDVLSSMFALLATGLYLRFRETDDRRLWWWCVTAFACGLLCKVSIAPLPLAFILLDWLKGRGVSVKSVTQTWILWLLAAVFVIVALFGKTAVIGGTGVMTTLLLSFKASAFYLMKLFIPMQLSVLYPQAILTTLTQPDILASIAAVLVLIVAAVLSYKKYPTVTVGIAWFFLFLIPTFSNFLKNGHLYFASDRYAYLPSIGIFLIIATAGVWLADRVRWTKVPLGVLAVLVGLCFAALTRAQVPVWYDTKSLFENVIRFYPNAAVAHNNLAPQLEGNDAKVASYKKAIELDPGFILPYRNIGANYNERGDWATAKQWYEQGLAVLEKKQHPVRDDLSLYFEFAELLDQRGESERAIGLLQKAVTIDPTFSESHYNLGVKYEKYGRLDEAETELQQALDLGGDQQDFLYHLAAVKAATGKLQAAAELLERLVKINPEYPNAERHLATLRQIINK